MKQEDDLQTRITRALISEFAGANAIGLDFSLLPGDILTIRPSLPYLLESGEIEYDSKKYKITEIK